MTDENRKLLSGCLKKKLADYKKSGDEADLKQVKELLDKDLELEKIDEDYYLKQADRESREKLAEQERELKLELDDRARRDKLEETRKEKRFRVVEIAIKVAGTVTPIVLFVMGSVREKRNLRAISNFEMTNTWTTTAGKTLSKKAFDMFKN